MKTYKAFVVEEVNGKFNGNKKELFLNNLPENDVLIRVHYSSLNYKDALSATGNRGVTRRYPHTPGIDAAGIVEGSKSKTIKPGEKVIVTGYDLGMNTPGGFAEYIRVPGTWVVSLPKQLNLKEAMILGTAGLTASAGIDCIHRYIKPNQGNVLVTGASGGVGSLALMILSKLGYSVTASTGKMEQTDLLVSAGAKEVIDRNSLLAQDKRALLKTEWAAVFDTVGGETLETVIKSTQAFGVVTCCGNVSSANLMLTVYPFILRGIKLMGISSQNLEMKERLKLWQKLAGEYKPTNLSEIYNEIKLKDLPHEIEKILEGKIVGRNVINLF